MLPGQESNPSIPQGNGFGAVRVNSRGKARFMGMLADGTRISQTAPISKNGTWPFYVSIRRGSAVVLGWLSFTNGTDTDVTGTLSWIKSPDGRARWYSQGFAADYPVIGSVYNVYRGSSILKLTSARVEFSGGNLTVGFTNSVTLDARNRVTSLDGNRFNLRFAAATGLFNGLTTDPATGQLLPFKGAVLQKRDAGYGFLLGTDQSSPVLLTP